MHRHRRWLSPSTLAGLFVAMTTPPASAEYNPKLGRFLQADPNGTGLVMAPGLPYHGINPTVTVSMAYELQFGDGMNFYEYLRSNPGVGTDPSGLKAWGFDYFAGGDQVEQDWLGQRLYTLGSINEGARWASLGLQTTLDIAGGLLGLDVFDSVQVLASGRGGFWDAMNIMMAVAPFGRIAHAGERLWSAAKFAQRARRGFMAVDKANDLARLARRIDKRSASYKQAVRLADARYPKKVGRIESHHVVPQYLGGPKGGPTVELPAAYHQLITNAFRRQWAYGQKRVPTPEQLREITQRVYNALPLPK